MSGNPHHAQRERGEKLAAELANFIRKESASTEEAGQAMLGAYEYFDRRTRLLRGESPWQFEDDVTPELEGPNGN
jgi:hypothetical protein